MKLFLWLGLLTITALPLSAQVDQVEYDIFSIYFGGGSYYIDQRQARNLVRWLDEHPDLTGYQITIHSHTDDIGPKEYNDELAQMRSQAALRRLIQYGIEPGGISIEDFGELNPVYDNSTMEGKLRNRRVDIIIRPVLL